MTCPRCPGRCTPAGWYVLTFPHIPDRVPVYREVWVCKACGRYAGRGTEGA